MVWYESRLYMRNAPNVGFSWEDDAVVLLLLFQVEPPNALIAPWLCEPELFSEHQPGSQPIHGLMRGSLIHGHLLVGSQSGTRSYLNLILELLRKKKFNPKLTQSRLLS